MRSRKLLALLFCLITFPAIAGYMTLLGAGVGSIAPVVSWVSGTDAFPSSSLTYSGPSLSTMFDSTGKLTYKPNNWLLYSNTFTNAAWLNTTMTITNVNAVADPFGGTNATTLAAAGATSVIQQFTARDAATGLNTLWMRRRTGTGQISLIKPDGSNNYVTLTGTWQQVTSTSAQGGTYFYFGVQINTAGDAIDVYYGTSSKVTYETTPRTADQVITTSSAYYGPRIDYDPNTLAVKGLLIEEARTNLLLQSTDPTNASWIKAVITVAKNVTSVDGTANSATTITATAGAGVHALYQQGASATTVVTNSIIAKAGTASWIGLGFDLDAKSDGAFFNLSTGAVGTVAAGATASTPINLGNGWWLFAVTRTYASAAHYTTIEPHTADNQAQSWVAAGTETIIISDPQQEGGAFATSRIRTATASVTRAADVVQFTGAALTALQGSAGSAIVQSRGFGLSNARARIISTTSDSPLNAVLNGTSVTVDTYNAAVQILNSGSSVDLTSTARYGVAWSASGRSIAANGGAVGTDANQVHGGSTAQAWLGSEAGGSAWGSGWYQSFAIYNQRLPDATLQAKSVVGASY